MQFGMYLPALAVPLLGDVCRIGFEPTVLLVSCSFPATLHGKLCDVLICNFSSEGR